MQSININIIGEDFEQDVRPLVKAFFPNAQLFVSHEDTQNAAEGLLILLFLEKESMRVVIKDAQAQQETLEVLESFERTKESEREQHRKYRNQLLRALYRVLSQKTGEKLPWGILTGVRPAKLILDRLEEDKNADIFGMMNGEYYCSDEKISLGMQVAKRELALLESVDYKRGYSIYVGIPFCPSICNYCSFGSTPLDKNRELVEPYLAALKKEISASANFFKQRTVSSVYIGGGTPTTLSAAQLYDLIAHIRREFLLEDKDIEFCVEAGRPDTITADRLKALLEMRVNRISINPQSMVDRTLEVIGRSHTADEIDRAFYLARELGHKNINMDMILGLTGESVADVEYTLSRIEKLNPEGLTVHTLALKRAARLVTQKERYEGQRAYGVSDMQKKTFEFAHAHDYFPYYLYRQKNMAENLENIGYAKNGRECLYNVLIMEEKQIILAMGAGASSKIVFQSENRFERVENVKSVRDYILRIDEMIDRKRNFIEINDIR